MKSEQPGNCTHWILRWPDEIHCNRTVSPGEPLYSAGCTSKRFRGVTVGVAGSRNVCSYKTM